MLDSDNWVRPLLHNTKAWAACHQLREFKRAGLRSRLFEATYFSSSYTALKRGLSGRNSVKKLIVAAIILCHKCDLKASLIIVWWITSSCHHIETRKRRIRFARHLDRYLELSIKRLRFLKQTTAWGWRGKERPILFTVDSLHKESFGDLWLTVHQRLDTEAAFSEAVCSLEFALSSRKLSLLFSCLTDQSEMSLAIDFDRDRATNPQIFWT